MFDEPACFEPSWIPTATLVLLEVEATLDRWHDLGGSLPGGGGPPLLSVGGSLQPLTLLSLELSEAAPGATAGLFFGIESAPAP